MNQRLNTIRENAINVRECLSKDNSDHQDYIFKLDRIIRGTVFVRWLHRIAAIFFILFAAFFVALLYPSVKPMLIMLGIAVCGYGLSLLSVFIQMKLYESTIAKAQSLPQQEIA